MMDVNEFDASGWIPQWGEGGEEIDRHREGLLSCVGHQIVDSWLVWNLANDEWFADLPVVLMLDDGRQLEVCWWKLDELSITWNSVDVNHAPTAWSGGRPLIWRSQAHHALEAVNGGTISGLASTEHRMTTRRLATGESPDDIQGSSWLFSGLLLATDRGQLHIFNALDENGLENETGEVGPYFRVTQI